MITHNTINIDNKKTSVSVYWFIGLMCVFDYFQLNSLSFIISLLISVIYIITMVILSFMFYKLSFDPDEKFIESIAGNINKYKIHWKQRLKYFIYLSMTSILLIYFNHIYILSMSWFIYFVGFIISLSIKETIDSMNKEVDY